MKRIGDFIQTYSGKQFFPLSVYEDDIVIEDIAHALSNTCRYSGHSLFFYSVAEHSYIISKMVPSEYALEGLLHDAAEAYLTDIPRPIKPMLPEYVKMEHILENVISNKYDLMFPWPKEVKESDNRMLKTEYNQIMDHNGPEWEFYGEAYEDVIINGWTPTYAKEKFLERFNELVSIRNHNTEFSKVKKQVLI